MAIIYERKPILRAARRCGLLLNSKTLDHREIEAHCPFCGENKPDSYHLYLNTEKDQFYCQLCGASGNSVSLYAQLEQVSNREAYEALSEDSNILPMPAKPQAKKDEKEMKPLNERHLVYSVMLQLLGLSDDHRQNLLARGLSEARIAKNGYASLPESYEDRRQAAALLSDFFDLEGIPGFARPYDTWRIYGKKGLLIPVRSKDGMIQGLQIRLDDADNPKRKFRALSSGFVAGGYDSKNYLHVTGNINSRTAYFVEGPLKGDVASYLDDDALFICNMGVNSTNGLIGLLKELRIETLLIATDMDKLTNWRVKKALDALCELLDKQAKGLKYTVLGWNPAYNGIDDYYLARKTA